MSCIRCEWEGSKVRQPSAELYPEFKEWMDFVFSDIATKTGSNLLYIFELPDPAKRIEALALRKRTRTADGSSRCPIPSSARSRRCSPGCRRKTGRMSHDSHPHVLALLQKPERRRENYHWTRFVCQHVADEAGVRLKQVEEVSA